MKGWAPLAALLVCLPALAADRPPATPTRDVDVLYDVPTNAGAAAQRLRFNAARQIFRIDPPGKGIYVILDLARGRMFTVREDDRSVIDMAAPQAWMPGISGGAFTRRGPDRVAGLACTDWATTDSERRNVLVCMTEDGVMLRARTTNGLTLITARDVRYTHPDDWVFLVPQNYRRLAPPPIPNAR